MASQIVNRRGEGFSRFVSCIVGSAFVAFEGVGRGIRSGCAKKRRALGEWLAAEDFKS
jgi:hypothetical protein